MTWRERIRRVFSVWMDAVAASMASTIDHFVKPRTIRIVQNASHQFELRDITGVSTSSVFDLAAPDFPSSVATSVTGSRVELVLQPDRFLFRPLELPNQATGFLQGIIRAQIDRLTPWTAASAAFGASEPIAIGSERVVVTVAATARAFLEPFENALTTLGAHSFSILVHPPASNTPQKPIPVLDARAGGASRSGGIKQGLTMTLAAFGVTACIAVMGAAFVDVSLAFRQADVTRQLNQLRAAAGSAQQTVERRKMQAPAVVVLLDALSEILPDHTHVTELRIEANKVRVSGVSRDAASLIGLIEKSGRFTSANFFAPTVRSQTDAGERFHIEAIIQTATASGL